MARPIRAALFVAAALAFAAPARAEEAIVKPEATPAPKAGPTVAAAEAFCGDPVAKAEELFTRYSTNPALKQVHKTTEFVAYSDSEKSATVMYTFTVKGQAAHPAAVCRKIVKDGDAAVIKMDIVCDGGEEACTTLRNAFNVLTAQMQAEADSRIKDAAKK
ncbi:MAG: hypothetical protein ABL907_21710 [Hyphomicrobium sp.]